MIAKLFTTFVLILTLLFQNAGASPAKHTDDVQLKAVIVSDIHTDADFARDRNNLLRRIFSAIGNYHRDADTIVMPGDLTNSGDKREYVHLQHFLDIYCRIRDRVPELGNHDSWNHSDDPNYSNAQRYFLDFCNRNGIKTDTVYYTNEVNGIRFIVLGVEDCDFKNPYHSKEQLEWFERELKKAVSGDKPVFVVCHKPVDCLGDSAQRVEQILTECSENAEAPVVFVSGHMHEIGENTFAMPNDKLVYLNLPSLLDTEGGGLGFIVEVKESDISITGMNFLENKPLEDYVYNIAFSGSKTAGLQDIQDVNQ